METYEFLCCDCVVLPACKWMCKLMLVNTPYDGCRYSENLFNVLKKLRCSKILKVNFDNDYQGHVDIDCLLKDGRVFSYYYSYGSCSGCDTWEGGNYTDEDIEKEMIKDATFFDSLYLYNDWVKLRLKKKNEY